MRMDFAKLAAMECYNADKKKKECANEFCKTLVVKEGLTLLVVA